MRLKTLRFLFAVVLVSVGLSATTRAWADDAYVTPSLRNFMQTLVRFGALDLRRDDIIDDYGRIVECKIYQKFYTDDFKWQEIRAALRKAIKQNIATFPTAYRFDAVLQLDRYDFKDNLFRFTAKTAQASSNTFTVKGHEEETCIVQSYDDFPPMTYKFVLDQPLKLLGIPVSQKDGELLLARMNEAKNKDRLIYARFNLRVSYIAPISPKVKDTVPKTKAQRMVGPMVTQELESNIALLDSRVDSIEYFEDPERTKLIYSFTP